MPKHQLLTLAQEAALSKKVQDWLLLQSKHKDFGKKHGRMPTNLEWAGTLGISEEELNTRWKDGNQVCFYICFALHLQTTPLQAQCLFSTALASIINSACPTL